jgi:acylphosphatase
MKRVRAIVSGQVQGVWYRAHTRDQARELGVHGYVRNLPNGDVEIVAQGEDRAVDALIGWARSGPPLAAVSNVRVSALGEDDDFSTFEIRF